MTTVRDMQLFGEDQERRGFAALNILSGQFFEELIKNPQMITPDFLSQTKWSGYIDPVLMFVMKAVKPTAFTDTALYGEPRCRWNDDRSWSWDPPYDCGRTIRENWCGGDIPEYAFQWLELPATAFFDKMKPSGAMIRGYEHSMVDEHLGFGSERTWEFAMTGGFIAIQKLMAEKNPYVKLMELKGSHSKMTAFLAECQAALPPQKREEEEHEDDSGEDAFMRDFMSLLEEALGPETAKLLLDRR